MHLVCAHDSRCTSNVGSFHEIALTSFTTTNIDSRSYPHHSFSSTILHSPFFFLLVSSQLICDPNLLQIDLCLCAHAQSHMLFFSRYFHLFIYFFIKLFYSFSLLSDTDSDVTTLSKKNSIELPLPYWYLQTCLRCDECKG